MREIDFFGYNNDDVDIIFILKNGRIKLFILETVLGNRKQEKIAFLFRLSKV